MKSVLTRLNSTEKVWKFSHLSKQLVCVFVPRMQGAAENIKMDLELKTKVCLQFRLFAGFLNCNSTTLQSLAQLQGKFVYFFSSKATKLLSEKLSCKRDEIKKHWIL